jgi:pimeloyl-ACP methyl ester carboxylesterase
MPQKYEERRYESRDGLELYYRVYPSEAGSTASPVLCLPGLTRNSRDFERLAPLVARHRTVLAPDLRGRGRSQYDPQWARYQPATYLEDVWTLLAHEGIERTVVVGTSLGGLLAMMMAATRPAALSGIVLNDIGPEVDPAGVARISRYAGKLPAVANWEEAVAQSREVYGVALPDLPDEEWHAFARRSYREDANGRPTLDVDPMIGEAVRSAPNAAAPDLWPLWQALAAVPALAIRGAHSDILSSATFERMAKEKPDLLRVEIANRGHVPLLDEPDAITAIEAFLSRLP